MKRKISASSDVHPKLYHVTDLANLLPLLSSDVFKSGPWKNLSMTTTPDSFAKGPNRASILIDADKLADSGLQPVEYTEELAQSLGNDDAVPGEHEWRVLNIDTIPEFSQYIKQVEIDKRLTDVDNPVIQGILLRAKFTLSELIDVCERKGVKLVHKGTNQVVTAHINVTAAELKRYNANNRGTNTTDCVNRSISMAFGKDYVEVHRDLVQAMKQKQWGSWKSPIVYGDVIEKYGGSSFNRPDMDPITGELHEDYFPRILRDWIDEYAPTGVYLVETGHTQPKYAPGRFRHGGDHIVCVIDGVIYDSWDSSGEYVYNYVIVEGRKALQLSGIENQIDDIGMASRSVILEECERMCNKYGFQDGAVEIGKPQSNGSFGFKIPVRFKIERFEETLSYTFKLAYVFTPETSYEQAQKKVREVTKVRIYDRFYEINKQLKEKEEGYHLFKQSGLTDPYKKDFWYDGNDQRFYNSLPGWVKPFIKYLNVQQPGQYSDSYTLTFRPIPGDPRQDERVRMEAYDSSAIKKMLEWYKKDFSRPFDDYDPYEEF